MWLSNIGFAFISLASNKMRSTLTMLGILIGVFAVTVLMSISQGLRQEVSAQIEGLGSNVVVIVPGKLDPSGGSFGSGVLGISTLTNSDLSALRASISEIESVDAITYLAGVASNGSIQAGQAILVGAGPHVDSMLGRKQAYGRWINQADVEISAKVVVLDWLSAQTLFPNLPLGSIVGQFVTIFQQQFEVVGVDAQPKDAGSVFASFDPFENRVSIPLSIAQALGKTDRVNRILVRIKSTTEVTQTITRIRQELLARHGGIEDFTVLTQEEILKTFDSVFGILTNAVAGIAAISLIVGGIGIMNIMLVAVAERTKEIGIRKAVGATDGQILVQFLIESTILGFLGGLAGLGLSVLATLVLDLRLKIPTQITLQSVVLAVGISIGAGIIFGVVPALRAARKNPVEALRYE